MNQTVFDTSEICHLHGVRYAVFSPGSRNAPLSISFHRHKHIQTRTIVDERSAAFIALGIAQATGTPVVVCCTSGTALLNYGPAIAEAHYQNIPLIVLSADRPPEWIDHWDGQTIRQQNVFANFVKKFYQLPADLSHPGSKWDYQKKLREAIMVSQSGPKGPVHLNIPFREPFYPEEGQKLAFSKDLAQLTVSNGNLSLSSDDISQLQKEWQHAKRKLIVLGQYHPTAREIDLLSTLSKQQNVPIVSDIISNGQQVTNVIQHQDLFLQDQTAWNELHPDLIISMGKSLISKNMKLFLRSAKTLQWRIDADPGFEDPYQNLTRIVRCKPEDLLEKLISELGQEMKFKKLWQERNNRAKDVLTLLEKLPYSEFVAFEHVMQWLPDDSEVHLANSLPVRYANFISSGRKAIRFFANRGTSGIDGTNSTAVGHALSTERKTVLLTGDLSFLYDTNAFFHEYDLSNLFIIVFNNFGGGIFDMIPGPARLAKSEKEAHFTTPHHRDLKLMAASCGLSYLKANDLVTLELSLAGFFQSGTKAKVLEIQTDRKINEKVFKEIKEQINE